MNGLDLPSVLNNIAVATGLIAAILAAVAASWASKRKKGKRAAPSPSEDNTHLWAHAFAIVTGILLLAALFL